MVVVIVVLECAVCRGRYSFGWPIVVVDKAVGANFFSKMLSLVFATKAFLYVPEENGTYDSGRKVGASVLTDTRTKQTIIICYLSQTEILLTG
jgi:hypothetical protein